MFGPFLGTTPVFIPALSERPVLRPGITRCSCFPDKFSGKQEHLRGHWFWDCECNILILLSFSFFISSWHDKCLKLIMPLWVAGYLLAQGLVEKPDRQECSRNILGQQTFQIYSIESAMTIYSQRNLTFSLFLRNSSRKKSYTLWF